jgi:hypothetical protein
MRIGHTKDLKEQITRVAHDLINLEVNTIIKPNITGRKMPNPRHALIDIAKMYNIKLGLPLQDADLKGNFESFHTLREEAKKKKIDSYKERAAELTDEEQADLLILYRIKGMSDQIKGIFNALKYRRKEKAWDNDYTRAEIEEKSSLFQLTPDELVLIRKVWEIGVEEIAMQTVIQLDGDVVTRVLPKYAAEKHEALHMLHNQGVSTSLNFWGELVGLVKDFFEKIVKMFFPVR